MSRLRHRLDRAAVKLTPGSGALRLDDLQAWFDDLADAERSAIVLAVAADFADWLPPALAGPDDYPTA